MTPHWQNRYKEGMFKGRENCAVEHNLKPEYEIVLQFIKCFIG